MHVTTNNYTHNTAIIFLWSLVQLVVQLLLCTNLPLTLVCSNAIGRANTSFHFKLLIKFH